MATQALSLRRRAAYAVFASVLDEDALLDALRMQHRSMRGDSVSDIIGYIDQVAARHHIDAAVRKKLYEAYFKALKLPDDELPMDPWPLMQIEAASPPPPAPPPVAPAPPPPVPAASIEPVRAALQPSQPAAAAAPAPAISPASADQAVCAELMRAALGEVQRFHTRSLSDLASSALGLIDGLRMPSAVRRQVRDAWGQPMQHHWVVDAPQAELAKVVHLLYVALCEALGPVEADQVLMRAVRAAEQIPQARQFSPRKLI